MSKFTVQVSTSTFRRELRDFLRLLPEGVVRPAVKKITFDVLFDIVRGITVDAPTRVDTGRYRAGYHVAAQHGGLPGSAALPSASTSRAGDGSMRFTGEGLEYTAEVINHVEYALLVEDGTARMRPGNHVKRALAAARADVVAMTAELRKNLAGAFGGQ
jgi:hypothetical protein